MSWISNIFRNSGSPFEEKRLSLSQELSKSILNRFQKPAQNGIRFSYADLGHSKLEELWDSAQKDRQSQLKLFEFLSALNAAYKAFKLESTCPKMITVQSFLCNPFIPKDINAFPSEVFESFFTSLEYVLSSPESIELDTFVIFCNFLEVSSRFTSHHSFTRKFHSTFAKLLSYLCNNVSKFEIRFEQLLLSLLIFLCRNIDSEHKWYNWIVSGSYSSPGTSNKEEADARAKYFEALDLIIATPFPPTVDQTMIATLAVRCFGSLLLYVNKDSISTESYQKWYKWTLQWIRLLSHLISSDCYYSQDLLKSVNSEDLKAEYFNQLTCLQVILIYYYQNSRLDYSLNPYTDDFFKATVSLYCWLSLCSQYFHSDDKTYIALFPSENSFSNVMHSSLPAISNETNNPKSKEMIQNWEFNIFHISLLSCLADSMSTSSLNKFILHNILMAFDTTSITPPINNLVDQWRCDYFQCSNFNSEERMLPRIECYYVAFLNSWIKIKTRNSSLQFQSGEFDDISEIAGRILTEHFVRKCMILSSSSAEQGNQLNNFEIYDSLLEAAFSVTSRLFSVCFSGKNILMFRNFEALCFGNNERLQNYSLKLVDQVLDEASETVTSGLRENFFDTFTEMLDNISYSTLKSHTKYLMDIIAKFVKQSISTMDLRKLICEKEHQFLKLYTLIKRVFYVNRTWHGFGIEILGIWFEACVNWMYQYPNPDIWINEVPVLLKDIFIDFSFPPDFEKETVLLWVLWMESLKTMIIEAFQSEKRFLFGGQFYFDIVLENIKKAVQLPRFPSKLHILQNYILLISMFVNFDESSSFGSNQNLRNCLKSLMNIFLDNLSIFEDTTQQMGLIKALFSIMHNRSKITLEYDHYDLIRVPEVLGLFWKIYHVLELESRLYILERFCSCFENNCLNQVLVKHSNLNLLNDFLFFVLQNSGKPEELFLAEKIIYLFLSHSVNVTEFRTFITLLQKPFNSASAAILTSVLRKLGSSPDIPLSYFAFLGRDSGLILSDPKQRLLENSGMTFSCWLRLHSEGIKEQSLTSVLSLIKRSNDDLHVQSVICNFSVADETELIRLAVFQNRLTIIIKNGGNYLDLEIPIDLSNEIWYHVIFSINLPKKQIINISKQEVLISLYLNSKKILVKQVDERLISRNLYPDICSIGCVPRSKGYDHLKYKYCLCGDISNPRVWTCPIQEDYVEYLYHGTLDNFVVQSSSITLNNSDLLRNIVSPASPILPGAQTMQSFMESAFYFFHPSTSFHNLGIAFNLSCTFNKPVASQARLKNTFICNNTRFKDLFDVVGGLKIVLDFFHSSCLSSAKRTVKENEEGKVDEQVELWTIVFQNSIIDSKENQKDVVKHSLMNVFSRLLRKIPEYKFPSTFPKSLKTLLCQPLKVEPELISLWLEKIVFDHKNWRRFGPEVQYSYFEFIKEIIHENVVDVSKYGIVYFAELFMLEHTFIKTSSRSRQKDIVLLIFDLIDKLNEVNEPILLEMLIMTMDDDELFSNVIEELLFRFDKLYSSFKDIHMFYMIISGTKNSVVRERVLQLFLNLCSSASFNFKKMVFFEKILDEIEFEVFTEKEYELLMRMSSYESSDLSPKFKSFSIPILCLKSCSHAAVIEKLLLVFSKPENFDTLLKSNMLSEFLFVILSKFRSITDDLASQNSGHFLTLLSNFVLWKLNDDTASPDRILLDVIICLWYYSENRWKGLYLVRDFLVILLKTLKTEHSVKFLNPSSSKEKITVVVKIVNELIFRHYDIGSLVKKEMKRTRLLSIKTFSDVNLASEAVDVRPLKIINPWLESNIISLVTEILEIYNLTSELFGLLINLILWGILGSEETSQLKLFCELLTKLIITETPGVENGNDTSNPFFHRSPSRKILYLTGNIHQAIISHEFSSLDIAEMYFIAIKHWKIYLSSYAPNLMTFQLIDSSCLRTFLDSPQWKFALETQILPSVKTVEEEIVSEYFYRMDLEELNEVYLLNVFRELEAKKYLFLTEEFINNLETECKRFTSKLHDKLKEKYNDFVANSQREEELSEAQLRSIIQDYSSPTNPLLATGNENLALRLDCHENSKRLRLKMSINNSFDSHVDASQKRDKVNKNESLLSREVQDLAFIQNNFDFPIEESEESDEWDIVKFTEQASGDDVTEFTEKMIYQCVCEMIIFMSGIKGRFEISNKFLYFYPELEQELESDFEKVLSIMDIDSRKVKKWNLSSIREVHARRFMLQRTAIEIFLDDYTTVFLVFPLSERNKVLTKILQTKPPLLHTAMVHPTDFLKKSNLTEKWLKFEITNFDYLMALNTVAGRTYNDLTQYPVFPWILKDYQSEVLDLKDERSFRDLSKPIGALNPERLNRFIERYNSFSDPSTNIPKFFYGTHYSSSATVLFYMLRVEPFTSLHIGLQNGKFDHADRQFNELSSTYSSILDNSGDVKELIPEFYYFPEMFLNLNKFDLGSKQSDVRLNHVVLPKWCNNNPVEFVNIHRKALESDYVSSNLNHWIDLIFGYKQRGEEAVKAYNVFYYLTYEGAVKLDKIDDPAQRKSVESQINNFGQTPTQLFERPHPQRQISMKPQNIFQVQETVCWRFKIKGLTHSWKYSQILYKGNGVNMIAGFSQQHGMSLYKLWRMTAKGKDFDNFSLTEQNPASVKFQTMSKAYNNSILELLELIRCEGLKSPRMSMRHHLQKYVFIRDFKVLYCCNTWDGSLLIHKTDGMQISSSSSLKTRSPVTHLCISEDERYLVTSHLDYTCTVYSIPIEKSSFGLTFSLSVQTLLPKEEFILYGHLGEVTSVRISREFDLILTSSADGTLHYSSISSGKLSKKIDFNSKSNKSSENGEYISSVESAWISPRGESVVYVSKRPMNEDYGRSDQKFYLYLLSINGNILKQHELKEDETRMVQLIAFDRTGEYFAYSSVVRLTNENEKKLVRISLYRTSELERIRYFDVKESVDKLKIAVTMLSVSEDSRSIIVGLGNTIFAVDAKY